jgi:hypothetical protein
MDVRLEDTAHFDFITRSPSTGAAIDADSLPTCEVFEEANDTEILTPTITKRVGKTGNYRIPVAATNANGFEVGKYYNVVATATVGAVTDKSVVKSFYVIPRRRAGTVQTDGTNSATSFKTNLTEAATDWWKDTFLMFTDGSNLEGQVKAVTGFNPGTDFITTEAFTGVPADDSPFVLINI